MASLDRKLRKDLETTVKRARRVAEAGARKAVEQLGVGEAEVPKHLTTEQRALRNRLRAHGRQLGDRRDLKGVQATSHLVQECAYEHWHRMLFARFLAEADLLIEPESGVAITLDEVQELAREKLIDWLPLASEYAERMLPQIFRNDDPVLDISLPPETRSEMEDLLKGLSKPVFDADDSLGWVYQFWQSDKKDEVNKSEVKIGADELPAVTQLFTEDYMVLFLLHNTLGAWWAGKILAGNSGIATSASDEAAVRAACKVGDIDWTYLRFVRDTADDGIAGVWRPAAGVFEGWPKEARDLTVLDPCMGSGHFLVFALPIIVAFRMAEENLSQSTAVDAVLKENLFGLEIDPRCTQIAAFNLAFAAWRKVGHRPLPRLNIACSGLTIGATKAEWLKLSEKAVMAADPAAKRDLLGFEANLLTVGLEERVKNGIEALYDLFAKAPWLGSMIDPRRADADIFREGFNKLEPLISSMLGKTDTDDAHEIAVAAQGLAKASEILAEKYSLVATNVPYLLRGKQDQDIREYCEKNCPDGAQDLATVFLDRCRSFLQGGGAHAIVSPQNWLFLTSYKKFRSRILKQQTVNLVAQIGSGSTATTSWDVLRALTVITASAPPENYSVAGAKTDASDEDTRSQTIRTAAINTISRKALQTSPDMRFAIVPQSGHLLLSEFANSYVGFQNGDTPRWVQNFWEQETIANGWSAFQLPSDRTTNFDGRNSIIKWDEGRGPLARSEQALVKGVSAWGRRGVIVRQMRHLPAGLYLGDMYDQSSSVLIPKDESHISAIAAFVLSEEFHDLVRQIDPKIGVTNATFVKVPFDVDKWTKLGNERFPDGLPKPISNDPTQWLFAGHPNPSDAPLLVATLRLCGYLWPRQNGSSFLDCPAVDSDALVTPVNGDGIVCLVAIKSQLAAEQRLITILADTFGSDWSAVRLGSLLAEADFAGKSLDDWLRDGFFAQQCGLFEQRPFVLHIWDGLRDGFHALVNYHRLAAPNGEGRRTLEKLIYSYLGDWIDRQRADQKAGVEGADVRLSNAEHLKAELIKILEGEPPYDIFVRWKPLYEQAIGWDPDINDGVRINIRPFMTARTLNARGASACILRATPKIKWDKDRGKELPRDKADYPWFWGTEEPTIDFAGEEEFQGNRWNDLHYSRSVKQASRDRHASKARVKI